MEAFDIVLKELYRNRMNVKFLTPELYKSYAKTVIYNSYSDLDYTSEMIVNRASIIAEQTYDFIQEAFNSNEVIRCYSDDSPETREEICNLYRFDIKKPYEVVSIVVNLGSLVLIDGYEFEQ